MKGGTLMFWKSNGLQLYYEIIGNGIPIIMLHGYSCDNKLMQGAFEPIFKEIGENKFQRIYLDLPGMGITKTTGKIKNADDMLGVLLNSSMMWLEEKILFWRENHMVDIFPVALPMQLKKGFWAAYLSVPV